jgi:hypothetical protein
MSLQRMMTDTLQPISRTTVQDAYGQHYTWAPVGDPLQAKITAAETFENQGTENPLVSFKTATILGWPEIDPTQRIRDQHGRDYDIDGDPDLQASPSGRLKVTIVRLRYATDL